MTDDHSTTDPDRLDSVLAGLMRALDEGEQVNPEAWLARYPEFSEQLQDFFSKHDQLENLVRPLRQATANVLHVRCPHCHNPVELLDQANLSDISCPSCGSSFSLVTDNTQSYQPSTKTFGHFELLNRVGTGQFGSVWKARDTKLGRMVAIKIPRNGQMDSVQTEMFLRDARAAAQLKHSGIVSVHEVGKQDSTVYIVSDFVDGATLKEWLKAKRLTTRESAELCIKIAKALHHAHEQGVIHRDLKPGNIMMDASGEPHLVDFGMAKREAGEITMTVEGQILGTPAYMSPEQARGEGHRVDRRADIYSLGVILFELLTGELPFRGDKQMLLMQILSDDPPSPRRLNSSVARDMETICLKCLEKSPQQRYPAAKEVAEELKRFLNHEPICARPISIMHTGWRWCSRHPTLAAVSAASLLLLAMTAGVSILAYLTESRLRHALEKEQEENRQLGNSVDDLKRIQDAVQTDLSRSYSRLAGHEIKRGRIAVAEKLLQLCNPDHRDWEWHHYKKQCDPVVRVLSPQERVAFADAGHLEVLLAGEQVVFGRTWRNEFDDPPSTAVERAASKFLDAQLAERTSGAIKPIALSQNSDGTRAAVSFDCRSQTSRDGGVIIFDSRTGELDRVLLWSGNPLFHLAFGSDDRWLAAADEKNGVIWDVAAMDKPLGIYKHEQAVFSVRFSPDGKYLVSGNATRWNLGGEPETVHVWDVATGSVHCVFDISDTGGVYTFSFDASGTLLAAGCRGKTIVWNLASGERVFEVDVGSRGVALHPSGRWLAYGMMLVDMVDDFKIKILSATEANGFEFRPDGGSRRRPRRTPKMETNGFEFRPDGGELACTLRDGVSLFDMSSMSHTRMIKTLESPNRVTYHPNGSQLAVSEGDGAGSREVIEVFDTETGSQISSMSSHGGMHVFDVAYSVNGRLLATAHGDAVFVWDSATGELLDKLYVERARGIPSYKGRWMKSRSAVSHSRAFAVDFSSDGQRLAVGWGTSVNNNVLIWDVARGKDSLASRWELRENVIVPLR